MPGAILLGVNAPPTVPETPLPDLAVAWNHEQFDFEHPQLVNPAGQPNVKGSANRPGQSDITPDVYTRGNGGLTNTLGGQPLPVSPRITRPPGDTTYANGISVQWRLGVGQRGPSSLGVANTVQLAEITNNPPQPGDLTSILAGLS